jgi:hypothetical protein
MNTLKILLVNLVLFSCVPTGAVSTSENEINILEDGIFVSNIKTVQVYPQSNDPQRILLPPAVPFSSQNLMLEFDDLSEQFTHYTIKITHCQADWTKSGLANLDFLTEYNSFPILNYSFSADTFTPYIHYTVTLPVVKIPGNYVATIYRDDEHPVFSKRFFVYQQLLSVTEQRDVSGAGQLKNNQPISLAVQYGSLPIINSNDQFQVNIRQNQRWDNQIENIPPTIIREQEKQLVYLVTDENQMHKGGNEYRFVDLRSLINAGQNISTIERNTKPYIVHVGIDKPRQNERYSQYLDFNGNYVIQNFDSPLTLSENYVRTRFYFKTSIPENARVYLIGKFNDDIRIKNKSMVYDSVNGVYFQEHLLKQGWYNYLYKAVDAQGNTINLEGNHFETENEYEIFVYYKSLQPRADLLAGYLRIVRNQR